MLEPLPAEIARHPLSEVVNDGSRTFLATASMALDAITDGPAELIHTGNRSNIVQLTMGSCAP